MRMNLKNYNTKYKNKIKFKFKIKFTIKNLYIFLISFTIIAITLGILFFFLTNENDKEIISQTITNNFTIKESYNYISILKEKLLSNTYNIFVIWILGLSIIGVFIVIFLYFLEMFSIGFTLSAIINTYKVKGILGAIIYLFPSKILLIITMFILTLFSIKMSYKLIKLCFFKEEINIKKEVNKYFKVLIFLVLIIVLLSIIETFINPVLINLFNKI